MSSEADIPNNSSFHLYNILLIMYNHCISVYYPLDMTSLRSDRVRRMPWVIQTHSICSNFELLADESRDLFQAEKEITVVDDKQIYIFALNGQKLSFWVKIAVILWISSSFQLHINHVIHQPTAQNLNKCHGSFN